MWQHFCQYSNERFPLHILPVRLHSFYICAWTRETKRQTNNAQSAHMKSVYENGKKSGQSSKPGIFCWCAACMADFEIEIQKVQAHGNFRGSHWDISQKRILTHLYYCMPSGWYPHIISYTHWWTYFKTMTTHFFSFLYLGVQDCLCTGECAPCSTVYKMWSILSRPESSVPNRKSYARQELTR